MKDIEPYLYRILLAAVVLILGIGTVFYHYVERFSWLDAYYFCVVTLATVGYGDLTPKTDIGKLFTTFYILAGVGIITAFITVGLKRQGQRWQRRRGDTESKRIK